MPTAPNLHEEKPVAEQVVDIEKEYVLQNYARYPILLVRGKGAYVYDASGKRYLDLISGIGVNAQESRLGLNSLLRKPPLFIAMTPPLSRFQAGTEGGCFQEPCF